MNPFINRLRGLLALGVALTHASDISQLYPTTSDGFYKFLFPLFQFGGFDYVLGFIVISGYCIARSTKSSFSIGSYAALRATRLFPSLIVCACFAGLVEWVLLGSPNRVVVWNHGLNLHNFIASLFGMSGYYGQFGSFSPTYTVSFELLFYAVWGAVLALSPALLAVPVSLVAGILLYFLLPFNYGFSLVLFGSWLMGAALAVHEREIRRLAVKVPLWAMWLVVLILFIAGNDYKFSQKVFIWNYPGSLVTLAGGLMFAVIMACHLAKDGRELQLDRWLGDISYPVFLIHGPIMMAVASALKASGAVFDFGEMLLILLGSAILAAQLVFVFVERPVMRLRKRLSREVVTPGMFGAQPMASAERAPVAIATALRKHPAA
jgi:peptidoglycan/LPS O-acetylase OafA/YrhL